ncbi:hypothetical protein [Streptomyces sp. NPDC002845]
MGGCNAIKLALARLTGSLAQEVAGFTTKVTLVAPGSFATDWGGSSAAFVEHLPAHEELYAAVAANLSHVQNGDCPRWPGLADVATQDRAPSHIGGGRRRCVPRRGGCVRRFSLAIQAVSSVCPSFLSPRSVFHMVAN